MLHIAIVGAGATGVELAAELHNTVRVLAAYGLQGFDPARQIRITVVEAGPRILPGLPEYIADETLKTLAGLGVEVLAGERAVEVTRSTACAPRTGARSLPISRYGPRGSAAPKCCATWAASRPTS